MLEIPLSLPSPITDLLKKGNVHMRIAIPTTGDCLNPHFGHCEKFALVDVDPKTKEVTATTELVAPEHQPGLLPVWLKERGVNTEIYYPVPLHMQQCFAYLGHARGDFPESEAAAEQTLALPIYPELSDQQAEHVVECVAGFYRQKG